VATLKINSTGSSVVFKGLKFSPAEESEPVQAHVKKGRGGDVKANAFGAQGEGEGEKQVCGQRCVDKGVWTRGLCTTSVPSDETLLSVYTE